MTAIDAQPLVVADRDTGKAVWIGRIEEHGQPSWAALTVSAAGDRIGGIDALIRRKEYGAPYAEPQGMTQFAALPASRRTSREKMVAGADAFAEAMTAKPARAPEAFAPGCRWAVSSQDVGDCAAAFGSEPLARIERVRDRSVLAVDDERGLVAVRLFEDLPAVGTGYPLTLPGGPAAPLRGRPDHPRRGLHLELPTA